MDVKALLGDAFHDGMTVEELTTALNGIEMPTDQSAEIERLKGVISTKNTEAADWKKKYQGTLDEATRNAQAAEEEHNNLLERVKVLEREKTIAGYKATFIGMGYAEELAMETATAIADGNMEKALENQKKHQANMEQKIRADVLKDTPRPGGSNGSEGGDGEDVKLAKRLSKAKTDADNTANDALKAYMR